jgi:hypothetical protein
MERASRGTKAKNITSCDNAFVTNILSLPLRLHYAFAQKTFVAPSGSSDAPQEAFLCAKAKRQQQCFICAKAKRQRQSAQSERKSTTRYRDEPDI